MKKLLRTSLCMMALLSLEQAHAKPKETKQNAKQEAANKDSWAYRNRYNIAGGAALIGAGAAGYLYQNEIADFVKSLTPQQAAEQVAVLKDSIAQDLKEVTKQEAVVEAKEHKSEESVAQIEADIAQKQDAIAKKQTMLESFYEYWASPIKNPLTPEEEAEWQKQNQYDREQDERENPKADIKEVKDDKYSVFKQFFPNSRVVNGIFEANIAHVDPNGVYHPAEPLSEYNSDQE